MAKRIVTVGGGTGTPFLNEALILSRRVDFIQAVVTTFDNGGATGIRRLNSQGEIAYSDAIRIFFSLIPSDEITPKVQVIKEWFLHRDSKNAVLGQEIVNRRFDKEKGFVKLEEDFEKLGIPLKGTVLPASTDSSHIVFTTQTGAIYRGEQLLDQNRFSSDMVNEMTLEPNVKAYGPAIDAISNADLIFLPFGSMYGSVLCNFLPLGMKEAMKSTKAKVYLVTNLFSTRNETHNMTPIDFSKLVETYTGRKLDGLIIPEISRKEFENKYREVAKVYKKRENSHFLGWEKEVIEKARGEGLDIITHNAINIINAEAEGKIIVRHDLDKFAEVLKSVLLT